MAVSEYCFRAIKRFEIEERGWKTILEKVKFLSLHLCTSEKYRPALLLLISLTDKNKEVI